MRHRYVLSLIYLIVIMSKKITYTIVNKKGEIETVEQEKTGYKVRKSLPFPAQFANIGFYLATPILIGIVTGKWLDTKFQTGTLYTTGLIIFGTIATFYNLYKFIKDASDKPTRSN